MSDPFIPAEEGLALTWMLQFAAGINSNYAVYMLTAADAAAIDTVVGAFQSAYMVATNEATRTKVTVAAKDDAQAAAEATCRQYASLIKPNAGISDPDKIAIGVRPVNPSREPVNVPDSSPLLNVLGATPGSQTVRFADTSTPTSAAKPFGATTIQLFVAVAAAPTTLETDAQFFGAFTKNPIGVGFAPEDDGKVATYFARWAGKNGEVGPWSLPISMRIAA